MDGTSHLLAAASRPLNSPIICFSSVSWRNSRRLRMLMSRFARQREVFFLEEPVRSEAESLRIRPCAITGVQVVTPMLSAEGIEGRRMALDLLLARSGAAIAWYTDPEACAFSGHVPWLATVYDCVAAPSAAGLAFEPRLIQAADLVFTGNAGLHEDRRDHHPNIHCFAGGIDLDHLETARGLVTEPDDQIGLPRPLLGRHGAVGDDLDLDLLSRIASLRPQWHFAMIGPIETDRSLPRAANIHWLGERDEAQIPAYLSHWDVAVMPLARAAEPDPLEAPRYLAAGLRAVATPVRDVTRRLSGIGAVTTAVSAEAFVAAAERAMRQDDVSDFVAVDDFLATISWDAVQQHMAALLNTAERHAAASSVPLSRFGAMPAGLFQHERVSAG